jgi:hypothetical protein
MMTLPLLIFFGCLIEEASDEWRYKPIAEEQQRLGDLL